MGIFSAAIHQLKDSGKDCWSHQSFVQYAHDCGLSLKEKTPKYISVDSLDRLDAELRENNTMVFRLGSVGSPSTGFALVRSPTTIETFFIVDCIIGSSAVRTTFLPTRSYGHLSPFSMLSGLSETALVNLAYSSGLQAYSLDIEPNSESALATGTLMADFSFYPLSAGGCRLMHGRGQVQVDGLVHGKRKDRQHLFIIEAKSSDKERSVAKHKLLYPLWALASRVPADIALTPVYLRFGKSNGHIEVSVAEFAYPDPRKGSAGMDELQVARTGQFVLPKGIGGG